MVNVSGRQCLQVTSNWRSENGYIVVPEPSDHHSWLPFQDCPILLSLAELLLPCQGLQAKQSDSGSQHHLGASILFFQALFHGLDFRLLKKF